MVANSRGARWNPPEFEAIYSSLHRQGADAELDNILARQSVAIHRPRELYKFNISLARVLDLRDGHGLEGFGLDSDALIQEDWTHTQALGHAAYRYLECAGILAPSARHAGSNLIVYLGGMTGNDGLSEPVPMPNGPVELP
jgi:RES domain-containing protein